MKLLYIQYAGDFAEAYQRLFIENGKENYYAQKYSVGAVVRQARSGINARVLVLQSAGFRVELEENLSAIGLDANPLNYRMIKREIGRFNPDLVVLRYPDPKLLRFLRSTSTPTFPVFADSFESRGLLRGRFFRFFLSRELRHSAVNWIANHQINAAASVRNLGVRPEKILPYDWEHDDDPSNWSKTVPRDLDKKDITVLYAGAISKEKGVCDLIVSLRHARDRGRRIRLRLAGMGPFDTFEVLACDIGVREDVKFLGMISHETVLREMNVADLVAVPSHHCYPEGLPMTIMESLMVHTPVVASDHPMFVGRVGHRGAVKFVRQRSPESLADGILWMCGDRERYKEASQNAPKEWDDLTLDLKWADMVNAWVNNPDGVDFSRHTLSR